MLPDGVGKRESVDITCPPRFAALVGADPHGVRGLSQRCATGSFPTCADSVDTHWPASLASMVDADILGLSSCHVSTQHDRIGQAWICRHALSFKSCPSGHCRSSCPLAVLEVRYRQNLTRGELSTILSFQVCFVGRCRSTR